MMDTGAPWWAATTLFAGALGMKAVDFLLARRKERTETDANVQLLEGLVQRVRSLEESHARTTAKLEEEVRLRMQAQEEAHRLRMRILTLEAAMRAVGAVIPEEVT